MRAVANQKLWMVLANPSQSLFIAYRMACDAFRIYILDAAAVNVLFLMMFPRSQATAQVKICVMSREGNLHIAPSTARFDIVNCIFCEAVWVEKTVVVYF